MRRYRVTIDLPIHMVVEAEHSDQAQQIGDERFADIYEVIETMLGGESNAYAALGHRYDDTEVNEID